MSIVNSKILRINPAYKMLELNKQSVTQQTFCFCTYVVKVTSFAVVSIYEYRVGFHFRCFRYFM